MPASPPGEPLPVLWSSWSLCRPLSSKSPDSPVQGDILVSQTTELFPRRRPLCQARLLLARGSHTLATFIDSGADVSLIDDNHQTIPVQMLISGNHHETISFHILSSPRVPLILGYPCLRRHNPHVDWTTGAILGWSSACHKVCLKQASAPQFMPRTISSPDLTGVPPEYHDFQEVFSKAKAASASSV